LVYDDDNISLLSSPRTSDAGLFSPFILNTQPTLQELFISLANKERRVLEARELLAHAEEELHRFKSKWKSSLGVEFGPQQAPEENIEESLAICASLGFTVSKGALGLHTLFHALCEIICDFELVIDDGDIVHGIEAAFCYRNRFHLAANESNCTHEQLAVNLILNMTAAVYPEFSSSTSLFASPSPLNSGHHGAALKPLYPSVVGLCYGAALPRSSPATVS
jgi:hypothetical protein